MKKLVKGVHWGFAAIFAVVFSACLVKLFIVSYGDAHSASLKLRKRAVFEIIIGAVYCVMLPLAYSFLKKKTSGFSQKKFDICFWILAGIVLVFQVISLKLLCSEPVNDLKYVNNAAHEFFKNWDTANIYRDLPQRHQVYFIRYPNNHMLLVIVSLLYKVWFALFGETPILLPMFVNLLSLFASYVMLYYIARQIFTNGFEPFFCALVGAFFHVFYTYTPFFYTDSMSMPYAMGSILLFLMGTKEKQQSPAKRALLIAGSALLMVIGYKIKGSVVILLPAYIIYLIALFNKERLKLTLLEGGSFIAGTAAAVLVCGGFLSMFSVTTPEASERYEFPPHHWIMMGLRDPGGYNDEDFLYTESFPGYQAKKDADVEMMKQRLSDFGATGFIRHIIVKSAYTWADGKYFIIKYIKTGQQNPFKRFITKSGTFEVFSNAYQLMLLAGILASFIYGAKHYGDERDISPRLLLLRIVLCGVYFFFLIWEARSRYLVNFTPVFIILAASSAGAVSRHFTAGKPKPEAE